MKLRLSNSNNCGKLMVLIGLLVGVPLLILPFYPEDVKYAFSFVVPAIFSVALGMCICIFGRHDDGSFERNSSVQSSSLIVLFAWMWGILIGAVPFVLCGELSPIRALFEAVSGWTTTGLSVMDVSKTSNIILFHRSFMQFCGGLGFVMVMVMLVQGKQSMNLYNAEGHPDKLMPNLKKTAQTIFLMYTGLLIVGTIAYNFVGMNLFDGICHTMCALSTGGFSTKLNSIGEYGNLQIELVTSLLMLIGTTNFAVLLLVARGRWRQVIRVSEVRFMFLVLLIFIPTTALALANSLDIGLGESFRHASFNIVSALSTTGYSTVNYNTWPPFALGSMILIMLIGGGIGSTAGGIKLTRVYLMLRLAGHTIRKRLLPSRNIVTLHYFKAQGKTLIEPKLVEDTTGFVVCYYLIFVIGTLLITLTSGCSLSDAMFEFASSLSTVGLSIGITSPSTNSGTLVVEMIGMILGRLEIFIIFIGMYSGAMAIKKHYKKR